MSRDNSCSLFVLIITLLLLLIFDSALSFCPKYCGGIEIPYPFGIGVGCYLNKWYEIQCSNGGTAFLSAVRKEVVHISLPLSSYSPFRRIRSYGSVRIKNPITSKGCFSDEKEEATGSLLNVTGSPFYVGGSNTLVAVGCNITASLTNVGPSMVRCSSGCGTTHPSLTARPNYLAFVSCKTKISSRSSRVPKCDATSIKNETICNGIGCCQASIPDELQQVVGVRIDENTTTSRGGCKVAFLTDEAYSSKHRSDPKQLHAQRYATVELGWFLFTTNVSFIDSLRCQHIIEDVYHEYRNKASCGCEYFADSNYTTCACNYGYRGNPYIPEGCIDIDECLEKNTTDSRVPCLDPGYTCVNLPGYYHCLPPKTHVSIAIGESWKFKSFFAHIYLKLFLNLVMITIYSNVLSKQYKTGLCFSLFVFGLAGIGIGFGSLILIGGVYLLYKFIKRKRRINRKKKFFKSNGGLLLQQQLISTQGNVEKTKVFSSKELEKATGNFSFNRILGQGGQGMVYKGMLVDGGIVAVKKSKVVDEDKLEEFINEVFILSQINHRNIVKLLGCCLETEVPILVYEFIPNGNLFEHLHDEFDDYTMTTWEVRLRIAVDVAGALSYLHSAASFPIYHRDIKSTNIMMDEKYRAKVSDFGTSRSVTVDHTHLTTVVSGTVGYVDPEYFQSSQFTDKSDVYSFGVVLVELITGEKPISFMRSQENRTLATYFILAMKENRLDGIIDTRIREESKLAQVTAAAKLARRCLNLKGRKRPNMREVSMELERIRSSHGDSQPQVDLIESDDEEETVEVNIGVESWNNVAVTENVATSFLDAEPLFPRQTW